MSIGQRIKELRVYLKLPQKAFAKGIYLSYGYIAEIELDHIKPNDRIIELISVKYGASRAWLETGQGNMFDSPPADVELEKMNAIFKELSPDYQKLVHNIIKQLLKLQKNQIKIDNSPPSR